MWATRTPRSFRLTSTCRVCISAPECFVSRPQKTALPTCTASLKSWGTTYHHPRRPLSMTGESRYKYPSPLTPQVGSPCGMCLSPVPWDFPCEFHPPTAGAGMIRILYELPPFLAAFPTPYERSFHLPDKLFAFLVHQSRASHLHKTYYNRGDLLQQLYLTGWILLKIQKEKV